MNLRCQGRRRSFVRACLPVLISRSSRKVITRPARESPGTFQEQEREAAPLERLPPRDQRFSAWSSEAHVPSLLMTPKPTTYRGVRDLIPLDLR